MKQFHSHRPKKRPFTAKRYDMVPHLMHAASDGKVAAVAILLKVGHANPRFRSCGNTCQRPQARCKHGLPGNEEFLDLAQAVRRAGWNTVTFNYRGPWGSPGKVLVLVLALTPVRAWAQGASSAKLIEEALLPLPSPLQDRATVVLDAEPGKRTVLR
jgi:hypothetical protein